MIQVKRYSKNKFVHEMSIKKINDQNVDQYINEFFICLNSSGWKHSIPYFKELHNN